MSSRRPIANGRVRARDSRCSCVGRTSFVHLPSSLDVCTSLMYVKHRLCFPWKGDLQVTLPLRSMGLCVDEMRLG